jgi:hypothetical protein
MVVPEMPSGTLTALLVLAAVAGAALVLVRRRKPADLYEEASRAANGAASKRRAALMRQLGVRSNVEFLATRACPRCSHVVGLERARQAEEKRDELVAQAHIPGVSMIAAFELGPIPIRCSGCRALLALDALAVELTPMPAFLEAIFVRSEDEESG